MNGSSMMTSIARATSIAAILAVAALLTGCTTATEPDLDDVGDVAESDAPEAPGLEEAEFDPLPDLNAKQKRLAVATAQAVPPDPPQTTGTPPDFARIVKGVVEGRGDTIRFVLEMSGDLPQTMPDESTHMIVAWNITGTRRYDTLGVTAQATTEGWQVMAGNNVDVFALPGTFSVEGNRFVMEVSWEALGIPRRFDWSASSTWQKVDGEEVHAAAQNIPSAKFPN